MLSKIIILFFVLSINIMAKNNTNVKTFVLEENGVEIIILYPKNIREGESIRLMGIMTNKYKNAKMGGLTLSFPQFRHTQGIYSDNTFDTISSYSPPNKIYSSVFKKNISTKYYMVEGWEKKWHRGSKKEFFINIKVPTGISTLKINVRGVLVFGKKKINRWEVTIPKRSRIKDQQGYRVKQLSVAIVKSEKINQSSKGNGITSKNNTPKTGTGTGFFIGKQTLLTNYHVIESCKSIEVIRNGYKSKSEVKALDKTNDLAVLNTVKENGYFLKFRAGKGIRIGETIVTMGYPLGNFLGTNIKLTLGNISSLTGLLNDSTKLQLTAPVQHGNSGGPLLDSHGNVVGIIYAGLKNSIAQNVNLAIKDNVARMFLDANDVNYDLDMNTTKIEVADMVDKSKNAIVEVVCHN